VLPELLHTVFLPKSDNLKMFIRALLMQKQYEEIRNNLRLNCGNEQTPNDLYFDYTPRVHKIWIACFGMEIVPDDFFPPDYALPVARQLAISALNTVLLNMPSFALSGTSLKLFAECLEHAWKSRTDTNANDEHSPPPWNTRTLTMLDWTGGMWEVLTDTPQGSAFLSSISYLTYGSDDDIIFDEMLSSLVGRWALWFVQHPHLHYNILWRLRNSNFHRARVEQ
jgi:hypothetical protein